MAATSQPAQSAILHIDPRAESERVGGVPMRNAGPTQFGRLPHAGYHHFPADVLWGGNPLSRLSALVGQVVSSLFWKERRTDQWRKEEAHLPERQLTRVCQNAPATRPRGRTAPPTSSLGTMRPPTGIQSPLSRTRGAESRALIAALGAEALCRAPGSIGCPRDMIFT